MTGLKAPKIDNPKTEKIEIIKMCLYDLTYLKSLLNKPIL